MTSPSDTGTPDNTATADDTATSETSGSDWLTVPDLVELLGLNVSRVRQLIQEHQLIATRRGGVLVVPAAFIRDGAPMSEIRGTAILLADSGFSDDEAVEWMLSVEESLGVSPIHALRAGRKAEVRRVAQALA